MNSKKSEPKEGSSTRSVHLCSRLDPATGSIVPPLIENAAFGYNDLDTWRSVALKEKPGYIYSRNRNPTTDLF
jgi:O-acetylhomoserine/O-acetylserine sulfhydrylase-like pyridoxal-dependent enzyme